MVSTGDSTSDATAGGTTTGSTTTSTTGTTSGTDSAASSSEASTTSETDGPCDEENDPEGYEILHALCAAVDGLADEDCFAAIGPDTPRNPCGSRCTFVKWAAVTLDEDVCEYGPLRTQCFFSAPGSEGCPTSEGCEGEEADYAVVYNDQGEVGHAVNWCERLPDCARFPVPECVCACEPEFPGW
jgi:hypothetical protein